MFPSLRDGSTLVPQSSVNPHGIAESVRRQADLGQMVRSQEIAAVALEELGYDVQVRENGAFIASVYSDPPRAGQLVRRGDRHRRRPRPFDLDLQELIAANKPGTQLTLPSFEGAAQASD